MRQNVLFGFVIILILISCGKDEETMQFPYSVSVKDLRSQQDVRLYIGGQEVTDPGVIKAFLNREPKFTDMEELSSATFTFLAKDRVIFNKWSSDTLFIHHEDGELSYLKPSSLIEVAEQLELDRALYPSLIVPSLLHSRCFQVATGWGDCSEFDLYYVRYKLIEPEREGVDRHWVSQREKFTGLGDAYVSLNGVIAKMYPEDTLAIREYRLKCY